ncbi:MAG: 2-oxoglutarate dehydrogenase, E2 component, dihydrolipoamide succinyltransferase [Acidobacteriales bacterium]|nr:2-oxoglutarate dehydrogenase, E2 component, dihydrolipoamide succinyltransferase [Terriglobales bacterium]
MTDIVMPQMGESIVEGTLTKWLKKPGERIEKDEALFEISTDKVDTEIPSPVAGLLSEVLVEEGKTVAINTVVGRVDETGTGAVAVAPAPAVAEAPKPAPSVEPVPAPEPVEEPAAAAVTEPAPLSGPVSPLVRRMAREHNIDLRLVKGSGAGGRVTKQDVEAYLAAPSPAAPVAPPSEPAAPAAPVMLPGPPVVAAPAAAVYAAAGKVRIEPMSVMRQKIAEHMVMSMRTSPHVTTVHKVDMTRVAAVRGRHKAEFQARYGISLTYLSFIARAACEALRAFPVMNASVDGTNIVYHEGINLSIAVALDQGLIVPVIRNADELNVVGLQKAIADLASRARSRQLKPDEVHGGTFTITNFGSFGSLFGTPVINQPQVGILGVGTVEKTPVVIDDMIAIRSICHIGVTFDHRLIDGATGDKFMNKLKSVLENWSESIL